MSSWYLVFLALALLTTLNLVLLFVPLPSFLRTKLVRKLDSGKAIFLGLLVVFLVLAFFCYSDMNKYHLEKATAKTFELEAQRQMKEFRAQRNFYMSMIGAVLSLITLGVNMKEKKIIDLEDKVQLKQRESNTKETKEVESSKDK
ncbi:predicted protein [Naegleria gruberi]|uniref:Endoplasmic reticulum transmembrane protein n=1 Tax=Naegleria gruberi TaxID=5762 RepID=D2VYR5_NAEGR|nr:uncharacterized protein NAEGRDRAFT_74214 [Naegleria gruberi]EFC38000.1 predicted protein [Naegleria gruberi]|eukprot:XP_002670744.1 predicted protein [Naegleria gruberi strain NEG-M]